jgi:hypothetical protein
MEWKLAVKQSYYSGNDLYDTQIVALDLYYDRSRALNALALSKE